MKQIHKLNGVEITEPINYEALEIELNFDRDSNEQSVSVNEWEFGVGDSSKGNDGAVICNNHINNGTSGGVGVGEGLPYEILLDNQKGTKLELFKGYVNLWEAQIECDLVIASAVEQGRIDWVNNQLDSFSFEYLESIGKITSSNYIPIPYCINKKQNAVEVIMAIVTVFVIIDKLQEAGTDLKEYVGNISGNPFTFTLVVGLVFRILYLVTLIVALIRLIFQLYNILIQPVKYHYGMRELDLMRIGLNHLGLNLSSSILENPPFNNAVIMPEKFNTKENNTGVNEFITGFFLPDPNEQQGFYKGTFGQLFRQLQTKYNAKVVIEGDTLHFEKQNFNIQAPAFQFPPLDVTSKTFNRNDFYSNRLISFATDLQDRNTIQEYFGTQLQITTSPISVNNQTMVLLNQYDPVNIGFALAKRKVELNFIEKILNAFFKVVGTVIDVIVAVLNALIQVINALIKALNKFIKALKVVGIKIKFSIPTIPTISNTNIKNLIEDRIGMMVLESDYTSVPKVMLIESKPNSRNNKLLPDNETVHSARYLWDNFWYYESFLPQQDSKGKQFEITNFENIPFCFNDFQNMRKNNRIFDVDGNEGEVISLKFNPSKETASGTYKIQKIYTTNLKETKTESNGR